jgi:threonine dehydrogenase-like Zn-dependent dehydrogenase
VTCSALDTAQSLIACALAIKICLIYTITLTEVGASSLANEVIRAFLVTERSVGAVYEIDAPQAASGEVVVTVARAGVCGTDTSLFSGDDARIGRNRLSYPIRLGHEWSGTVTALGDGVDGRWLGCRVTADTFAGCGRCLRCRAGRHYLCDDRYGIGVRRGWPGALAQQLPVPAVSLRALPDAVTDEMGALVEPGANAYRAVQAAGLAPGSRVLVIGPGSIGLLAALFAVAAGSEVHVLGVDEASVAFARGLPVAGAWTHGQLPRLSWDAVIDATDSAEMPRFALDVVAPGGRVVLIGVSVPASLVDSRQIVHQELQVFGVLGGSLGLEPTIDAYARGQVDPRPLIAGVVGLDAVASVLSGAAPRTPGGGTKTLVDPAR